MELILSRRGGLRKAAAVRCCIYSLSRQINSPVCLQDPSYAPFLGQLAKLVFLASSMHQLTVSVCSSLPYVIGQVGCLH